MSLTPAEIEVLSGRYSKALFDVSVEGKALKAVAGDLAKIQEVINGSENFGDVIVNPTVSKGDLSDLFSALSKKFKFNDLTHNFLKLLASERRCNILQKTVSKFEGLVREENNISIVEITTAKKIDKKKLDSISKNLEKALGKKIEIENEVDVEALAGLKLKVGSVLFDDTLQTKLQKLQAELAA